MKTQEQKTKELNGLRKYIRAKLIQETGQNPYSDILKDNKEVAPAPSDPGKNLS
jgi:hypothetical protein